MNQTESEALLALLILATYTDSHLSLKEDDALQTALGGIEWHSSKPREIFLFSAINRMRAASDTAAGTLAFLQEKAAQFTDEASQQRLLRTLQAIFAADGVADSEAAFLAQVKAAFPR